MHHNTRIILSLSAIMFVVGCKQSERLTINTQPLMSVVTVRDPQGTVVCSQPAPVDIRIPFKDLEPSAFYDIKITPPAESAQSFLPYAGTIKSSDYAQFPGESPVKKSMYVTLETKKFVTLETAELFVSNGVWKGWLTTSRAWQDIAEAGGQVPTLLMNFRDFAVQGISISPGGDRLVFSSVAFNKNNNEQPALGNANPVEVNQKNNEFGNLGARDVKIVGCNLQAISVNGGGIQQITQENFRDLYPRFSPDGQRILFSSNRRDPQGASLLSMSAAGKSGIANNYIDPRDGLALFPSMSIDGTIAFSLLPKGTSESYIWSLGGTNQFPTQITVGDQPNISPDGKRIAYIGKDGNLGYGHLSAPHVGCL